MELPAEPECNYDFKSCHDEIAQTLRHLNSETCKLELSDKECVVCGFKQSEWDHYQLPCLHYAHTRCMRHWIFIKQFLQCPWCQDSTPKTKYCSKCKKWSDHMDYADNCPRIDSYSEKTFGVNSIRQLTCDYNKLRDNIERIKLDEYYDVGKKYRMIAFLREFELDDIDDIKLLDVMYHCLQQASKKKYMRHHKYSHTVAF